MRNRRYRLPSGREVYLRRFYMDHTYSGQMEGTYETMSRFILESLLHEQITKILSPGKPLLVLEPKLMPLPNFRLVADLESPGGTKTPYFNSTLFVCWFTDSISGSIGNLLKQALPAIDWEAHAEEYEPFT